MKNIKIEKNKKFKLNNLLKYLIVLTVLVTGSCTFLDYGPVGEEPVTQPSSSSSSQVDNVSSSVNNNQTQLNVITVTSVEVSKEPTKLVYTPNETVITAGGELRVVYSNFKVKYVPMRDEMIDSSRLDISSLGRKNVIIKYSENNSFAYTSYELRVVEFVVGVESVAIDIKESTVLINNKVLLNKIINPMNATVSKEVWTSSNDLIATVDNNGVVTPKNTGLVLITLTVNDKFSSSSTLNIISGEPIELTPAPPAIPALSQISLVVNSTTGVVSGNTAVEGGTLKYTLYATSMSEEINSWNINTLETQANDDLGLTLSTLPVIGFADDGKYLIAVEVKDDKLVAAGEVLIDINNEQVLSLSVSFKGVISNDTLTSKTSNYYIVTSSKQGLLASWNVLTPDSTIISELGALGGVKPTLTEASHQNKYLVVVIIENNKLIAAAESLIFFSVLNDINLSISNLGVISGDTKTIGTGTELKYFLSSSDKTSTISSWNKETLKDEVVTSLGLASVDDLISRPTLNYLDDSKYLLVLEFYTDTNKIIGVGQRQMNLVDVSSFSSLAISNEGVVSGNAPTNAGSVKYLLTSVSVSKQTIIDTFRTITTETEANSALGGTLSTLPSLTYTDLGKYLVVVEIKDSKVVAADQELVASTNIYTLSGLAVSASGVISAPTLQQNGTLKYAVVTSSPSSVVTNWTTSTTETTVNTNLGTLTLDGTSFTSGDIKDSQNNKYLVSYELVAEKVVSASFVQISLSAISSLTPTTTVSGSLASVDNITKTEGSTLYYSIESSSKSSVFSTWNKATTYDDVDDSLATLQLFDSRSTFDQSYENDYIVVVEIISGKVNKVGEVKISFFGTFEGFYADPIGLYPIELEYLTYYYPLVIGEDGENSLIRINNLLPISIYEKDLNERINKVNLANSLTSLSNIGNVSKKATLTSTFSNQKSTITQLVATVFLGIPIASETDLNKIAQEDTHIFGSLSNLNVTVSNARKGEVYFLTSDINLNPTVSFSPISSFSGVFSGEKYSINNLYIDRPFGDAGMFTSVITPRSDGENVLIEKLTLVIVSVRGNNTAAGLIGGFTTASGSKGLIINKVNITGKDENSYISTTADNLNYVGGIATSLPDSIIINSRVSINSIYYSNSGANSQSSSGGLAASIIGASIVKNNYVEATIKGNSIYSTAENFYTGGLFGIVNNLDSNDIIINNYFRGEIYFGTLTFTNQDFSKVGKIVGLLFNLGTGATASSNYYSAKAYSFNGTTEVTQVAAIGGNVLNNSTKSTPPADSVIGAASISSSPKTVPTFAGFDFTGSATDGTNNNWSWNASINQGFPYLKSETNISGSLSLDAAYLTSASTIWNDQNIYPDNSPFFLTTTQKPTYLNENDGVLSFDGGDGALISGNNLNGLSISSENTLNIWIKKDNWSTVSTEILLSSNTFRLYYENGHIVFNYNGNSSNFMASVTGSGWKNIIVTKNGTTINIYINNVQSQITTNASSFVYPQVNYFIIGRHLESPQDFLTGKIAIIEMYQRALTDYERILKFETTKARFGIS